MNAEPRRTRAAPRRARVVLILAGAYNLAWGGAVIIAPNAGFALMDLDPPTYPQIWQCLGMVVGVYGVGYLIAASDPWRHWPIVLVGLLGKIFGPIGFVYYAAIGQFPWSFGWTIITNDLLWWPWFVAILLGARRRAAADAANADDAPGAGS
ncbi:MAG: alkyl hydroperoxide reductase [Planctomycetota bacterium]|nr:alkyl hydroperoxide reductase [Planctomycetota bacterium]